MGPGSLAFKALAQALFCIRSRRLDPRSETIELRRVGYRRA
jgi:hypothetical protein